MTYFGMYVLPLMLLGAIFCLKPLRRWLERRAVEAAAQPGLVVQFQDNVAAFLRETDPHKHGEMREILHWSGHRMLDDGKLIRSFILFNQRIRAGTVQPPKNSEIDGAFDSLSDEARHRFSRAMGCALLVSSYRSMFFGKIYRSMLLWVLDDENKEVREPKQIVYRYRRARKLPPSLDTRAHC